MMPVIRTAQNRVVTDEPEPDDEFVTVVWQGQPDEGSRHARVFENGPWPICDYHASVAWAVEMADQMCFPLFVVPMRVEQALDTAVFRRALTSMSPQERGELRRLAVATLGAVMRDSDDRDLRTQAYDLLTKMGVIRP